MFARIAYAILTITLLASCSEFKATNLASQQSASALSEPLAFNRANLPQAASGSFMLSGKCLDGAGLTVEVQDSSALNPSCLNGNFEVPVTLGGADGAKVISIKQTDTRGRQWQDSVTVTKDTVAPALAIVNVSKSGASVVISGTCETGAALAFARDILSAAPLVCANGSFQVTATISANDGVKTLEISQTDKAGNRASVQSAFAVDTMAPVVTVATPAMNAQFTNAFTLTGACETGLDVVASGAGLAAMVAAPCAGGQYSLNGNLSAGLGNKAIVVAQTDAAQNRGQAVINLVRIAETVPAPAIAIAQPAAMTPAKAGLTISGSCQTGLTVNISGAVNAASTTSCTNGAFSAAIVFSSGEGNKTVSVAQTNAQGATGSASRNFIRDSIAPVVTIANPAANAFAGAAVTISGACETGIPVVLYGAGLTANASANCTNGVYSGQVTLTAGDGDKELRAGQTDAAQNAGMVGVTVKRDTVAPVVKIVNPAVGTMSATGLKISGTCETGLPVTASGAGAASNVQAACTAAAFSMDIVFSAGDGSKTIVVTQTDGAGNNGTDSRSFTKGAPQALDGAMLYAQHCALCHNPLATSLKLDRTATQIRAAITSIPSMSGLSGLTTAQVDAIALALKTTSANPGANPFFCQASAQPTAQRLQRLAKSEYVNTIRDLFTGVVALSELTDELAQFPEELNQDNPFDRGADSLSLGLVKAQNAISIKIASLVTGTTAKMNSIFSESCLAAATVTDACLTTFIDRFGSKVYRRPVKAAERTPLIAAYKIGSTRAESSAYLLRALLMSPNFLYHIENDGTPTDSTISALSLSAFELASRLSYMTVNSMPDATLMSAAANGSIMNAATYEAQMNRLLALPAARTSIRRFFHLWFELNKMRQPAYTAAFKESVNTANLNAEALEETMLFAEHVVFENKSLASLLTDTTAFVKSASLAQIYGISLPAAADGRTSLPAGQRAGVLTRVAYSLSGNDGTSPILRGVAVRRSLLCDPLMAPDPNSFPPGSLTPPPDDPLLSTRKRFENKTSSAACMSCHGQINPIGYALEGYDALGRFRTMEKVLNSAGSVVAQHPIDAVATINLSAPPDPTVNGGLELSTAIAGSQKFQACFSKKWFQFSMRKTPTALDNCALASTFDALKAPNATLLDAIKSSIKNSEFKLRRMK